MTAADFDWDDEPIEPIDAEPLISPDDHWCGFCGGDPLPLGLPCPAIELGRPLTAAEEDAHREYLATLR